MSEKRTTPGDHGESGLGTDIGHDHVRTTSGKIHENYLPVASKNICQKLPQHDPPRSEEERNPKNVLPNPRRRQS